jgi:hypothetical protein
MPLQGATYCKRAQQVYSHAPRGNACSGPKPILALNQ